MISPTVLVNVDWLALSLMSPTPLVVHRLPLPSGYSWVEMSSTAVWRDRTFLMSPDGIKVATVLSIPKSPLIDARRVLLEVANQVLYRPDLTAWVDWMLAVLNCTVTGINRVDLCGDFELETQQRTVVRGIADAVYYIKGVRRNNVSADYDKSGRMPRQVSWGGVGSVFHYKIYNKYKELHEQGECSKPYIEEAWVSAGLHPERMWRCEVSITDCNRLEFFEVTGLEDGVAISWRYVVDHMEEIYWSIYRQKVVIKEGGSGSSRRYDNTIYFLSSTPRAVGETRHRAPAGEMHSDAERRIACKMWRELQDYDVQANAWLRGSVVEMLRTLCERESCVNAIRQRFGVDIDTIVNALS